MGRWLIGEVTSAAGIRVNYTQPADGVNPFNCRDGQVVPQSFERDCRASLVFRIRRALSLIQGAGIGLTLLDVPACDRVNVTIAS